MTPRRKLLTNAGIGASAAVIVLGWMIPRFADATVRTVDARYVRDSVFRDFQRGLRERAMLDSATSAAELRELRRMVSGLDSSDRCRRGQRGYCR